ncbi:hypothetical protein ANN_04475 [Periplaneta americana]|uniref:Uncharacterized protein n=1 Tax=Periplaneta americana TaxID=6978 RepID=A0ABQ8TAH0_PERAM|nr:hypothetical protein ANN_04475 [Periplaneta americana]
MSPALRSAPVRYRRYTLRQHGNDIILTQTCRTVAPQSDYLTTSSYSTHLFYKCGHGVLVTLDCINIHSRGGRVITMEVLLSGEEIQTRTFKMEMERPRGETLEQHMDAYLYHVGSSQETGADLQLDGTISSGTLRVCSGPGQQGPEANGEV